jgi:hypothetical protein
MENVADTLDELRRRAIPAGGVGGESGDAGDAPDIETQREILVKWASDKGLALEAQDWLSRKQQTHGEHHVFFDPDKQRYFKITHAGSNLDVAGFAIAVGVDDIRMSRHSQRWMCVPYIRDATPFEYLERLIIFNRAFGDDIQIEGVICNPGQIAIVTSQPLIRGKPASHKQVREAMHDLGFIQSDCPPLGRKNITSLSFYHPGEGIAVFDTHAANFLVNEGIVAPIDALITPMDDSLEFYLSLSADQRKREIGLWTSQIHDF